MMRFWQIYVFLVFVVIGTNIVSQTFWPAIDPTTAWVSPINSPSGTVNSSDAGTSNSGYIVGTGDYDTEQQYANNLVEGSKPSSIDTVAGSIGMIITSILFLVNVAVQSVIIIPLLVNTFHIPGVFAIVLQTMYTLAMGIAFAQWYGGRNATTMG
jgi:hypothetical protein